MAPDMVTVKEEADMKRRRQNEASVDHISQLHDCILLYIMTFLSITEVVQTSILSKRWRNLWKSFPNLIINSTQFRNITFFKAFLLKFLSHCDSSNNLRNIVIVHDGFIQIRVLDRLFKYAMSHDVEKFTIDVHAGAFRRKNIIISNTMLSGCFLKYLDLNFRSSSNEKAVLPQCLDLPQLIDCRLKDVEFLPKEGENGYAEPFLGCKELRTLVIDCCIVAKEKRLYVSNDKLSKLVIRSDISFGVPYQVQMCTPNLKSFSFAGRLTCVNGLHQLFECDLKFLEEVSLEVWSGSDCFNIAHNFKNWLKKFNNVDKMILTTPTLKVVSCIPNFPNIEGVHFHNMKELLLKIDPIMPRYSKEVMEYLLKGSTQCDIIYVSEETPSYYDERSVYRSKQPRVFTFKRNKLT